MDKEKNAYDQLLQGLKSYIDTRLDNVKRDITTNGKITKLCDDESYGVMINGVEYLNIKTLGGGCYINEIVKVLIPQGEYNNMFILKSGGSSGSGGAVTSVNGKTGTVVLNSTDVGALSNSTVIPTEDSGNIDFSTYFT